MNLIVGQINTMLEPLKMYYILTYVYPTSILTDCVKSCKAVFLLEKKGVVNLRAFFFRIIFL